MSKLGLIGTLHVFSESDDFNLYVEQLEQYFVANDVEENKRASVLLSVIGSKTYKLLRNLITPKIPGECSYAELTKTLKEHFKPAPIVIAERFRFHRRNQLSDESIANFIVELRRLASTCEFGVFLEDALRDRFVCGLSNEATQQKLLVKKKLTLTDAIDFAQAMEIAEIDAKSMKMPIAEINKVQSKGHQSTKKNRFQKESSHKFRKCFRCGASHDATTCKYKNAKCHFCSKIGHIAPVCLTKAKSRPVSAKKIEAITSDIQNELNIFPINSVNLVSEKRKYIVPVSINSKHIDMELDTAADVSIVSDQWFKSNLPTTNIHKTNVVLKDYNQCVIEVAGEANVQVVYKTQKYTLPLVIVKGERPALFGKNWLGKFQLDWKKIFSVMSMDESMSSIDEILSAYSELFKVSTSPIKHFKAHLKMHENATPVFCKARPVPYSLKKAVCDEIKQSEKRGVWHFVEHSKWATPIVVVPKKNNSVRLCGDFKVTVNKFLDPNQYPLPTQQDLFATLRGGKYFSKLDLSHAYQQIELDTESQELLTLTTIMGLVRPTRLLYGITSAAAIFQSVIEQILQGLDQVICFQDDILISSSTLSTHYDTLKMVLDRLKKFNVHLNVDKCKFLETRVEFLGHIIDKDGIHPTQEKINAIKKMKVPVNVSELKSFLGILNYYCKFIPSASTLLAPLHKLLNKDVPWTWSEECNNVFNKCKQLLTSDTVLAHYDEKLSLQLSCDASPVGVGAVLSHIIDGNERPVAYASRTLTQAEKHYSQTEKEALSIIFGCKKFHQYLYGRKFVLYTDHQPLVTIFASDKAIPTLAAARLQRWALLLSSFNYTIKYKKGSLHQNADSLSRMPIDDQSKDPSDLCLSDVYKISYVDDMPITSSEIARATRNDKILGQVLKFVQYGFPTSSPDPLLKPYLCRKNELSSDSNCLLWGMRVIIPEVYRMRMLDLLHDTHPGITKMKAVARSHIWWPKLDEAIENVSKHCSACQKMANNPPVSPLQSWVWPKAPWERIHIDFAQKDTKYFFIIVDSYSKWLEVIKMTSTTAKNTINALRALFSRYGLPLEIVSDNGPQFTSDEFGEFLKSLSILHTLIPSYHPQSNGLAERSVQTFKSCLNKMLLDSDDCDAIFNKINRFLMSYRSSPHSTTGVSPAELFLGHLIRTAMDLVHPSAMRRIEKKQNIQKRYFDRSRTTYRSFYPGQTIWARSHRDSQGKWVQGIVLMQKGSRLWVIKVNGKKFLAHTDQLRAASPDLTSSVESTPLPDIQLPTHESETQNEVPEPTSVETTVCVTPIKSPEQPASASPEVGDISKKTMMDSPKASPVRRYPLRARKKPDKLDL